jgi:hypothetical protein
LTEAWETAPVGVESSAAPETDTAGSTAETQLLVQAAEGEVNLFARVERLSREERARLTGAIEQLLASHGFAAGEIRLSGPAEPVRPPREEK